ncbi:ABC transporter ATP-binding protein [Candidatus Woesearchaeota archaeon]|nr:ABC transporter ATP-binding protein [Candidatus Woesearchaeota archaeon]MBW3016649.1 ABC transporter ATP-binding protein [Candidatus Woesearchaeota archaeon]
MISVQKLSKHFGGVFAVRDCSFTVQENAITSVIGPNGAGKTTLFNLVCGILKPDNGRIFLRGTEITSLPVHRIARCGISRTFQQARLFRNMTVRDNLLLARKCSDAELKRVLKKVYFPLGLDTLASDLSYGQMRLLEIARALLKPHALLMLDEPTAGVNPKVRQELKRILLDLKGAGATILLIEHDMEFVMSISDEVVVMAEGSVLTRGTPGEVQSDKRVLEAYLGK